MIDWAKPLRTITTHISMKLASATEKGFYYVWDGSHQILYAPHGKSYSGLSEALENYDE